VPFARPFFIGAQAPHDNETGRDTMMKKKTFRAALLAASILSIADDGVRERLDAFRAAQTARVLGETL
jgi:phosphoribosylcarboxyaminoimidazole (NCAIR) mutase